MCKQGLPLLLLLLLPFLLSWLAQKKWHLLPLLLLPLLLLLLLLLLLPLLPRENIGLLLTPHLQGALLRKH